VASRWDVSRAVRQSPTMEPSARLVMLTLAEVADNDSAVVPEEFGPSLTELALQTGLSRSTVAKWLDRLEAWGWVGRTRPSVEAARAEGAKTQYSLTVGTSPGDGLVQLTDQEGSPGDGLQVVRETDGGSPGDGRKKSPSRTTHKSPPSSSEASPRPEPDRPDVEALCTQLADRIVANGNRPPTISKKWRDAARLLLDRDGMTFDQVAKAIDWCQGNEFWRGNILSMPTLREKYDRLRQHARREQGERAPRGQLQERNGVMVSDRTAESVDLVERIAAKEAAAAASQQLAIEGATR